MDRFSVDDARRLYSVPHWSEGYFDIDERGRAVAQPLGPDGPAIALSEVVAQASSRGLRMPLLVRFTDILSHKLGRMQQAFADAIAKHEYGAGYTAVFPIKVNQQRSVVQELVRNHGEGFGLEAGSKPELLAVLALSPGGTVICNGYKDREFIRLALMGRKLGMDVIIVIEKAGELKLVLEESRALGIEPGLGVRLRLTSIGAGKWQNTGGDKAKFGLMPKQIIGLLADLDSAGLKHCLRLLHFHMGSQISNVRDIANGMREAVQYWRVLSEQGVKVEFVDVGGGLGVDYEGSRSRSSCSVNYGLQQYAEAIVEPLAAACAQFDLPPPRIITEAGRAMTAHHAVLLANVTAVEETSAGKPEPARDDEHSTLGHLREIFAQREQRPPAEIFSETQFYLAEGQAAFARGELGLRERADLDELHYAILRALKARLSPEIKSQRHLLDEVGERLVDKYFLNFSVFQSVPDVWALDQVFPILPIERLNERPTRRGVIEDLTCDSDGRIDHYVESQGLEPAISLHALEPDTPYLLGLFMVGAYQETLGDMHNLFGDTDSVNVSLRGDTPVLDTARAGDSTDQLLRYVGYQPEDLKLAYRAKVAAAGLSADEGRHMLLALESGLSGYTYLAD